MADVYSIIIEDGTDSDWWDGTESWGGETNETNRDAKYSTRVFTSFGAWEADRTANGSAENPEIAMIVGPWTSEDSYSSLFGFPSSMELRCPVTLNDGQTNPGRHTGIAGDNANAYIMSNTNASVIAPYTSAIMDGIHVKFTNTGTNYTHAIYTSDDIEILNCIVEGIVSGDPTGCSGIALGYQGSGGYSCIIKNTEVFGFASSNACYAFYVARGAGWAVKIYNSAGHSGNIGLSFASYITCKNSVFFNNTDDVSGSGGTLEYCAGDDSEFDSGTGNIPWDGTATDWDANFTDYTDPDLTPLDDDLPGAGIGNNSDGDVPTTDIVGNARDGDNPTVGTFEYQAISGITVTLDRLIVESSPKDLSLSLGTATISLDRLVTDASLKDLTVSPDITTIALDKLLADASFKELTVSPSGEVGLSLNKLTVEILSKNLTIAASGEANISLDKLFSVCSIKDLSPSVGALSILLDKLSALAFAKNISPFGTGEVDVILDKLYAILSPKKLTLSVNENVVFLNTLPANLSPKSLNLSLGEAIILLDKLAAVGSIKDIGLSFGELGISLDKLSAIGSIKDVSLSMGEITAFLNKLSVLGSIEDISAIGTGEIGIALDKLSAQGAINDLIITAIVSIPLDKLSAVGSIKDLDLSFLGEATIPINALSAFCSVKEITVHGVVLEINIPFSFHSGFKVPSFKSNLSGSKFHSGLEIPDFKSFTN